MGALYLMGREPGEKKAKARKATTFTSEDPALRARRVQSCAKWLHDWFDMV